MRFTQFQRWGQWWEVLCTGQWNEMLIFILFRQHETLLIWQSFSFCSGICREGDHLVVGPTELGQFHRLTVGSIQRNRSACRVLRAGQAATLALGNFDRSLLRKVRHLIF